jgi:hypothetical protein
MLRDALLFRLVTYEYWKSVAAAGADGSEA